jgi:2,3-bisphosphoglycerate-dependent phosphoglycerate mutase
MKFLLFTFTFLLFTFPICAQNMTIILVRHAEKDSSPTMNRFDPDLAPEGRQRALKLFETVKNYKPQRIFSTNLRRTRFTVDPLATNLNEKFRIYVEAYNPGELEAFVGQLLKLNAKTILVVGHSNTTPQLANLLIKQEKYKDLGDGVYNKIYIIRIKGKKVTDEVIEY